MPITQFTTPVPTINDPVNFAARADILVSELPDFVSEANALAVEVNAKQASTLLAASNAATSASNASASEASAQANATIVQNRIDEFDVRYLGSKTSDPLLDNDGNPLIAGAFYLNTVDDVFRGYTGTEWVTNPSANAGSVAFTQAGAGATVRTVQAKLREFVSVKDFGAVGDGVTDDTLEIQAAIDYADSIGAAVHAPAGRYLVSELTLPENMRFYGDGIGVTTFVQTGNEFALLSSNGSIGAGVSLASNAAKGANTLEFTTTGISANDWLLLADDFSYASTDSTYKSGELVQVLTVDSAAQVTLYSEISGSMYAGNAYETANSAYIKKVTFLKNVTLENFSIDGDVASTTNFIFMQYCQNCIVQNVEYKNCGDAGVYLQTCQNSVVQNTFASNIIDDQANGHSGYAVNVGHACSDIRIVNNSWERCRHGFTTIGGVGFPHNVLVQGNLATHTSQAGIDTHAAGSKIYINDNQVRDSRGSGIQVRSTDTVVSNNYVINSKVHGISGTENNLDSISIIDNSIFSSEGQGLTVSSSCDNLMIVGNNVFDSGNDGITIFGSSTRASANLVIANNTVQGFSRILTTRVGIIMTGSNNSAGALIKDNYINSTGGTPSRAIRTLNISDSIVSGNVAKGTYSVSVFDLGTNYHTNNLLVGTGNFIQNNSSATGAMPALTATGYDTNIDVQLTPKGTGNVRFGTNTANADAPVVGYITIKDAGGTARKLAVIA